MTEKTKNKKDPRRLIFGAMAFWGILELLEYAAAWLIRFFGGISFNVTNASSIGIIGGADGPTAIFVTASPGQPWEGVFWLLLTIVGIWGFRHFSKPKE